MSNLTPGISVIIASHAPHPLDEKTSSLLHTLDSVAAQSINPGLVEVVVVFNGEAAQQNMATLNNLAASRLPSLTIRLLATPTASAGRARNLGLSAASREYLTFLDDDDALEPHFLESGLSAAAHNACVLLPIVDWDGALRHEGNSLNARIQAITGSTTPISTHPWALGFNACKLVPTAIARRYRFEESLKSGEDVVFFAHLLAHSELLLTVPAKSSDSAYLRTIRAGSVSRQREGFDFNVIQRLDCIAALRRIAVPESAAQARQSLENAQFGFVHSYLERHPDQVEVAIGAAVERGVAGLEWEDLRAEKARRVVFSYCFPPYADTSANVAAKVIRTRGELVDVYYASMARVRSTDETTGLIVDPFVVHAEELTVEPSFSSWNLICDYARKAARSAARRAKKQGGYDSMYSRAMWSGSHVAGALFKMQHPAVHWEAEFSDPLYLGADGAKRPGELSWNLTTRALSRAVRKSPWAGIPCETHFELTELATMMLADELVFTNANQREVMLSHYPAEFRDYVSNKSIIRPHAVPTPEMYHLVDSPLELDPKLVHIAYFGNFYPNRGIGDVLSALELMEPSKRSELRLHLFVSDVATSRRMVWGSPAAESVTIHPFVPYLEFLNAATQFDALLANDTSSAGTGFAVNPFLPSKYADYAGTGVPVWGIVEEGSPMSTLPLDYSSPAGDVKAAHSVLCELVEAHGYNHRIEFSAT